MAQKRRSYFTDFGAPAARPLPSQENIDKMFSESTKHKREVELKNIPQATESDRTKREESDFETRVMSTVLDKTGKMFPGLSTSEMNRELAGAATTQYPVQVTNYLQAKKAEHAAKIRPPAGAGKDYGAELELQRGKQSAELLEKQINSTLLQISAINSLSDSDSEENQAALAELHEQLKAKNKELRAFRVPGTRPPQEPTNPPPPAASAPAPQGKGLFQRAAEGAARWAGKLIPGSGSPAPVNQDLTTLPIEEIGRMVDEGRLDQATATAEMERRGIPRRR